MAQKPETGRACEEIRKGYRKYLILKHIIFYKLKGNDNEVVRVLYQIEMSIVSLKRVTVWNNHSKLTLLGTCRITV